MCESVTPHPTPASPDRRSLLMGMGAVGAAAAGAAMLAPAQLMAQDKPQNAISPAAALKRIMDGNARYVGGVARNRDYSVGRSARASSQHPVAAILGCADSRLGPEVIFDEGPGDLFVVRVAGNFVTTEGLASLEFSTKVLGAPLIMVLGHSGCGAVNAAIQVVNSGAKLPGHLPQLVDAIKPAVRTAAARKPADLLKASIQENVRRNVAFLSTSNPLIAPLVKSGRVRVVGAEYEIATGKVTLV